MCNLITSIFPPESRVQSRMISGVFVLCLIAVVAFSAVLMPADAGVKEIAKNFGEKLADVKHDVKKAYSFLISHTKKSIKDLKKKFAGRYAQDYQ